MRLRTCEISNGITPGESETAEVSEATVNRGDAETRRNPGAHLRQGCHFCVSPPWLRGSVVIRFLRALRALSTNHAQATQMLDFLITRLQLAQNRNCVLSQRRRRGAH